MGKGGQSVSVLVEMVDTVPSLMSHRSRPEEETVEVQCAGTNDGLSIDKKLLWNISADFKQKIFLKITVTSPTEPLVIKVSHSQPAIEVLKPWLYGGRIRQQDATLGLAEELHVLMEAHAVGEGLHASDFQDEVVDAAINIAIEHGHKFTIGRLSPPKVKDFPSRTSKMRELLADWIAYGEFDDQRSNASQLPKDSEFTRLLVATFVERKIKDAPAALYLTNPCKYHAHRKTNPCSAEQIRIKVEAKDWGG